MAGRADRGKYRRMTTASLIALAALALPDAANGAVPDWVHLLPRGEFCAHDGRGPWHYDDAATVIEASFAARPRIHIDLNHSTDTAAKVGLDAPAVGYVLEMEERDSGIWARVDWTARGRELLSDRAYWGISAVISFDRKSGRVRAIARAALTNDPAVATLTPLHAKETDAMITAKLAGMLGLAEDATEDEVLAALEKKMTAAPADEVPLAALSQLGTALGLDGEVSLTQIVAAARGLRAAGGEQGTQYAALQARVVEMETAEKRRAATAFVDQAIRDRRAGVKAERDTYVALHMERAAWAEKLVGALPQLGQTATSATHPSRDGTVALSAEHLETIRALGIAPDDYKATLERERAQQEALQ